jgi:hypothetical protein
LAALILSAILQAIIGTPAQAATDIVRQCANLKLLDKNSPPKLVEFKGSSIIVHGDDSAIISYNGKSEKRTSVHMDVHMDKYDFADILEIMGVKVPYDQLSEIKSWNLVAAESVEAKNSGVESEMGGDIAYIELRTTTGEVHKIIQAGETFGICQ